MRAFCCHIVQPLNFRTYTSEWYCFNLCSLYIILTLQDSIHFAELSVTRTLTLRTNNETVMSICRLVFTRNTCSSCLCSRNCPDAGCNWRHVRVLVRSISNCLRPSVVFESSNATINACVCLGGMLKQADACSVEEICYCGRAGVVTNVINSRCGEYIDGGQTTFFRLEHTVDMRVFYLH